MNQRSFPSTNNSVKIVPAQLVKWRIDLGLSRPEASRQLGISSRVYTNMEWGHAPIPDFLAEIVFRNHQPYPAPDRLRRAEKAALRDAAALTNKTEDRALKAALRDAQLAKKREARALKAATKEAKRAKQQEAWARKVARQEAKKAKQRESLARKDALQEAKTFARQEAKKAKKRVALARKVARQETKKAKQQEALSQKLARQEAKKASVEAKRKIKGQHEISDQQILEACQKYETRRLAAESLGVSLSDLYALIGRMPKEHRPAKKTRKSKYSDQEILDALEQCGTHRLTAEKLGVKAFTVARAIKRTPKHLRPKSTYTHPGPRYSDQEILAAFEETGSRRLAAKKLGVSNATVNVAMARIPKHLRPDTGVSQQSIKRVSAEQILEACKKHNRRIDAADALGVTVAYLYAAISKMPVDLRPVRAKRTGDNERQKARSPKREQILQAYASAMPVREISKKFGITSQRIYQIIRKAGVPLKGRRVKKDQRWSDLEILEACTKHKTRSLAAESLGVSLKDLHALIRRMPKERRPPRPERARKYSDQQILDACKQWGTQTIAAEKLGVSFMTVNTAVRRTPEHLRPKSTYARSSPRPRPRPSRYSDQEILAACEETGSRRIAAEKLGISVTTITSAILRTPKHLRPNTRLHSSTRKYSDQEILDACQQFGTVRLVVESLKISTPTVYNVLRRTPVHDRPDNLVSHAKFTGTISSRESHLHESRRKYSDQEILAACEQWGSRVMVAEKLGISESAIYRVLHRTPEHMRPKPIISRRRFSIDEIVSAYENNETRTLAAKELGISAQKLSSYLFKMPKHLRPPKYTRGPKYSDQEILNACQHFGSVRLVAENLKITQRPVYIVLRRTPVHLRPHNLGSRVKRPISENAN